MARLQTVCGFGLPRCACNDTEGMGTLIEPARRELAFVPNAGDDRTMTLSFGAAVLSGPGQKLRIETVEAEPTAGRGGHGACGSGGIVSYRLE